jgi:DedD protein
MNSAHLLEEEEITGTDGELHLGMGSLIGIFFGLALVCGVFMGFGYMMGHRTPGPYISSEPLYEAPKSQAIAPKPSAEVSEQPSAALSVLVPVQTAATQAPDTTSSPAQSSSVGTLPQNVTATAAKSESMPKANAPALVSAAVQPSPVPAPIESVAQSSGTIMVQIAAVKSRPDAQALAAAVTKDGFTANIRTEPQDKLFHVQVGPFETRDEAKAMRQKLAGAGYNAFIK